MIRKIKLPSFTTISAGGTAILNLPLNLTYDMIQLVYANGDASDVTDIRVLADGKVFQRPMGGAAGYDYLNDYYNRGQTAASTEIWFQRPEMTSAELERLTSFGTANLKSATIEIDIAGGMGVGFGITAYAIVSAPTPMGLVTKIKTYPFNAGAGLNDISSIVTGFIADRAVPTMIAAIHLYKAADDVTSISMDINGTGFWDEITGAVLESQETLFGRDASTAGYKVLDFILDGNTNNAMQCGTVRDLRLKPTCTAAGMMTVIVEYFDGLGGVL